MSPVKRGDLLFLTHPGTHDVFSGYGLAVESGSAAHLVGLLLVDRPRPVSTIWLNRVKSHFGEYKLYPMTQNGERGIACEMWIDEASLSHVQPMDNPMAHLLHDALLTLLIYPPVPKFLMSWHNPTHFWQSTFHTVKATCVSPSPRRKPLFPLGQVVATPGALEALTEAGQLPQEFLHRHVTGDWGTLPPEDVQANEASLKTGARLFSSYTTHQGVKIWVITEWDRSATTLLLPSEY